MKARGSNPFRIGASSQAGLLSFASKMRFIRTAEVEEVTGDGSIMWLRFDGNPTRQLITKTDGYDIRPVG